MDDTRHDDLLKSLNAFGSDLSRWPKQQQGMARAALLAEPAFRRAFERERSLDRSLAGEREGIDRKILDSGAAERTARQVLARLPAGFEWRRIAAAMVLAGMLGGALDFFVSARTPDATDVVMLDPLYAFEDSDIR